MTRPTIAIIVAVARNRVIGRDNGMPWHLPTDLKHFKTTTLGKPVIMGRKTFQSIGRPLPGRHIVVVSGNPDYRPEGVDIARSLDEAIDLSRKIAEVQGTDEIIVAGGGELYRQAMAVADRLYITEVDSEPDGDTRFPEIDPAGWRAVERRELARTEKDSAEMRLVVYERAGSAGCR